MKNLTNSENVATWFVQHGDISPKKLQKLMYYAYAWGLVFFNDAADDLDTKLFDGEFEAWVHGPVNREIYDKYGATGFASIKAIDNVDDAAFHEDVLDLLKQTWTTYGKYNANELERLTHSEKPWQDARKGLSPVTATDKKISDEIMFEYYGNELGA